MSLTSFSCASASAAMMTACRPRSASSTARSFLMDSSCSATVRSTATRSRMTSAISRFSASTSFSAAIRVSSRLPLPGDDLEQPVLLDALVLDGDDPLAVLRGDGDLAGLVLALHAELLLGA